MMRFCADARAGGAEDRGHPRLRDREQGRCGRRRPEVPVQARRRSVHQFAERRHGCGHGRLLSDPGAIWHTLLNDNCKTLLDDLDTEQTAARAMQRAWVAYRDTTCRFYDANPRHDV